jgi:all-trans-retinol dehydrogenase (NAD+)
VRDLASKTVLITGGARGLGRRLALELGRRGAKLVLWDLDAAALAQAARDFERELKSPIHVYPCDVTDRAAVRAAADRVRAEVGDPDVVVNNAGVVSGKGILELSDEQIERTFDVNALAPFWVTRAFLPAMVEKNSGHVVTVASASGLIGVARLADYAASKWAAVGFDESLRSELRTLAPGVKTTVVCPYYIDTGMFDGVKSRFSFLLPILREEDVAKRVARAIERDVPRVIMPALVHLVPPLRLLPVGLFDRVADLLGVNASMDEFVGHGKPSTRAPELRVAGARKAAGTRRRSSRGA